MHAYGKFGVFFQAVQRFVFAIIPLSATLRQAHNSGEDLQPSRLQSNSGRSAGNTFQCTHTHTHTHYSHHFWTLFEELQCSSQGRSAQASSLFLSRSFASWWLDIRCWCRTDAAFSRLSSRFWLEAELNLRAMEQDFSLAFPGWLKKQEEGKKDVRNSWRGDHTYVPLQDSSFLQAESFPNENKGKVSRQMIK